MLNTAAHAKDTGSKISVMRKSHTFTNGAILEPFIWKSESSLHDLPICTGQAQQLRKQQIVIFTWAGLSSEPMSLVLSAASFVRNRVGHEDILWCWPWPGHLKPPRHHPALLLIRSLWSHAHTTRFSWLRNC